MAKDKDKKLDRLNIYLPRALKVKIKVYAAQNDSTIKEVIVDAVQDFFKK